MIYNRETVKQLLSNQPFEPVEIVTTAGQKYRISHPENYMLTDPLMVIALDPAKGYYTSVAFAHIVAIEHLHASA